MGPTAAIFFFDKETIGKHWFFVNVLSSIIFFIAFVQMLYYVSAAPLCMGLILKTLDRSDAMDDWQVCMVLLRYDVRIPFYPKPWRYSSWLL